MAKKKEPKTPTGATEAERLANYLQWIRLIAGLHYFGGAFDPEHMRTLANMASDALAGKELPDFEDAMRKSRKKARKWADRLGPELVSDEETDEHSR